MVRAQQTVMRPRRIGAFAEMPRQRGRQDVLDQRGFARTAHTSHRDPSLQGKFHRQVLQIVGFGAFQDEPWGGFADHAFEPHTHLSPRAQVHTGQSVDLLELIG